MGKSMNRNDSTVESKYDQPSVTMSPNLTPTSPLDLSINSKRFPFTQRSTSPVDLSTKRVSYERQIPVEHGYEPPQIIIQPKSEWHYRSIKDLAKQHLPFLAGNGRQRTPIRVFIPAASNQQLFLGITLLTMEDTPHPSKVIVPARTKVNVSRITHDNNLNCLQFDENSTDYFDQERRYIYSKISPDEHKAQSKDIRVHMFNLYQNQNLTKDLIELKELNRCKLCFWLCVQQNGQYLPVSQPSFSITIEEKKMTTRNSRPSDQIKNISVAPTFYSQFYISNDDGSMDVDVDGDNDSN